MIAEESELIDRSLGEQTGEWVYGRADKWYQAVMIDSGFYKRMHYTLIPTKEQKEKSRALENFGGKWFSWIEGRIEAFADVVYQFMARAALLTIWAPYMLLLLIPALWDGVMTRQLKRTNFDYASPVIHRYSIRLSLYIVVGLGIAFCSPIALNPLIIPVVMMICCVLLGLMVGNLQKRI